jgi:transcriptional regulator with XRE-family HTH domain
MKGLSVLKVARTRAGLSQQELAQRSQTSRTAVSAYEHGRKSPSLETLERLLTAAGFELDVHPRVEFSPAAGSLGRMVWVPSHLPRLSPDRALATVRLPVTLNWSQPQRVFSLADRDDRARVYEIVLNEGQPDDIRRYIDGVLLVDLWGDLILPRSVRAAWSRLVDEALAGQDAA